MSASGRRSGALGTLRSLRRQRQRHRRGAWFGQRELARKHVTVLPKHEVDALADVHRDGDLGALVKHAQALALFRGYVDRGGDLFAGHLQTYTTLLPSARRRVAERLRADQPLTAPGSTYRPDTT